MIDFGKNMIKFFQQPIRFFKKILLSLSMRKKEIKKHIKSSKIQGDESAVRYWTKKLKKKK
jgi:hypothetical protein